MTRINVVNVSTLCDQHLLAEHRELTRIPNTILRDLEAGKTITLSDAPSYHLGKGHVTFFRDKLFWLYTRYVLLHTECSQRGFNVTWKWPNGLREKAPQLFKDYLVTADDQVLNRQRIDERMPEKPRFTPRK